MANHGVLKGVGRRDTPGFTIKGPLRVKTPTMNSAIHHNIASPPMYLNGQTGLYIQGSYGTPDYTDPNFSFNGTMFAVADSLGAPIFQIPFAGGPICYGDHVRAAPGVFNSAISLDGTTNPASIQFPSGFRVYGGAGAPATVLGLQPTNVGDYYFNSSGSTSTTHIYRCTVAGSPGTWAGFV